MKLYTSITSPYSRAIMLTALSQGMDGLALAYADPWTTPPELTAVNPLSQVPALLTDDGTVICGTAFVADYLFGHPLHSAQQAALAGYAQALLDQVVKAYSLAKFLPDGMAEHPHIPRAREAVVRGLQQAPALDPRSNEFAHHLRRLCRIPAARRRAGRRHRSARAQTRHHRRHPRHHRRLTGKAA